MKDGNVLGKGNKGKIILGLISVAAAIVVYAIASYLWDAYPLQSIFLFSLYIFGGAAFTGWRSPIQIASSIGILLGILVFFVRAA